MGIPVLWFRLEGAFQSWGDHSKWDFRGTRSFPTRSGITGLLACAMGLPRDSEEIGRLGASLKMAIRADRRGERMTDFQVVHPTIPGEGMQTINRRKRTPQKSVIASHREYLMDASFLVAVTGSRENLERIRKALEDPVWCIYLGRRSCVPSVPVIGELTEEYNSLEQALREIPLAPRHSDVILCQVESEKDEGRPQMDVRVSSPERRFAVRYVQVHRLECVGKK